MKILIVASLAQPATSNYMIRALLDAEHDVFVCSDTHHQIVNHYASGGVDVAEVCATYRFVPDLLLFIEGGTMRIFPVGLEKLSCLTAWYGIDTHMDYAKHLRIGRLFDITFIAQKEYVDKLRIDGLKQVFWLPLAFAPELHSGQELDRCYEVAYVGSNNARMHPTRHALLSAIRQTIPNVFQGMASPEKMGKIYAQAKMVFNKSVNNDVNMRYFEAMGAGAVLLTDHAKNNGVEELFISGKHFFEYDDEKTLIALIKELSSDPERCRRIGEAARRHVLDNHTYAHRMSRLLEQAGACVKQERPSPDAYFAVFMALRMPADSLKAVHDAFNWETAGRGQQFAIGLVRCGLSLLTVYAETVEYVRRLVKARR